MISFYELLGMIKEDKAPNKIRVHLTSKPLIYKKDDDTEEYCYYVLEDEKKENDNYKYYLMDNYLESMMFDETIEIIEEEKKIPEKLIPTSLKGIDNLDEKIEIAHIDTVSVIETVNQVIDYLKSKGE